MIKYLIAFGPKPKSGFLDNLRSVATEEGVDIKGAILMPGPGCWNLALLMEENEPFIRMLTLALMPAKWATTNDLIPEGEFTHQE